MGVSDETAGADVAAILVDIDAVGSGDIAWGGARYELACRMDHAYAGFG